MAKELTDEDKKMIDNMVECARNAMKTIENYTQTELDQLCQAIGWYTSNETTFSRLARMGVEESTIGDAEGRPGKRFKIQGVLRDALRQKSVGVVEDNPAKGIMKYAKPAGVIASLIPMTNPALTPPVTGIYALAA